jgi:hypothetical protein
LLWLYLPAGIPLPPPLKKRPLPLNLRLSLNRRLLSSLLPFPPRAHPLKACLPRALKLRLPRLPMLLPQKLRLLKPRLLSRRLPLPPSDFWRIAQKSRVIPAFFMPAMGAFLVGGK